MTEQEKIERRNKVVNYIRENLFNDSEFPSEWQIADWHLAEIDRIVEPLIEMRKNNPISTQGVFVGIEIIGKAIDETLNRAKGQ